MITLDKLKNIGIDPEEGLARCMGSEALYLKLVQTIPENQGFVNLENAIAAGDLDAAFEAAHALKGTLGNLSLNTLYDPMAAMTEDLRARKDMDYGPQMDVIMTEYDRLKEQCQ